MILTLYISGLRIHTHTRTHRAHPVHERIKCTSALLPARAHPVHERIITRASALLPARAHPVHERIIACASASSAGAQISCHSFSRTETQINVFCTERKKACFEENTLVACLLHHYE